MNPNRQAAPAQTFIARTLMGRGPLRLWWRRLLRTFLPSMVNVCDALIGVAGDLEPEHA